MRNLSRFSRRVFATWQRFSSFLPSLAHCILDCKRLDVGLELQLFCSEDLVYLHAVPSSLCAGSDKITGVLSWLIRSQILSQPFSLPSTTSASVRKYTEKRKRKSYLFSVLFVSIKRFLGIYIYIYIYIYTTYIVYIVEDNTRLSKFQNKSPFSSKSYTISKFIRFCKLARWHRFLRSLLKLKSWNR